MCPVPDILHLFSFYYCLFSSGVICNRRVPAIVKGKVYKVAVRPAMLYGLETVALTKRQEAEMEVAEFKMMRFSLGMTRMDKIRNEYIRGTAQVGQFGEKTREARLRWYGHLRRKDNGYCITLYFRGRKISRKVNLKYFREKIFSRIYCSRENNLPAKISSRENIFSRKYLPAKISSRENRLPASSS